MGVFFINWITQLKGPTRNLLLRTSIFFVYLLFGAVIFKSLESQQGHQEKNEFRARKQSFQQRHGINESEFDEFIEEVRRAVNDGYFDVDFDRWSFFGSVFFTATVLTTIGFGHMAPCTFPGRLFCIFYALFGIPLTGLMLKSFGERLVSTLDVIGHYIQSKSRKKSGKNKPILSPDTDQSSVALFTTVTLFVIMLAMLLLLAGVSMKYEGWTFFEGCYFGFITLSTIGFGDYVPTTPHQGPNGTSHAHVALFIILTAIYITLGLSVVSSVLVSLSRIFESKTDWEFVSLKEDYEECDTFSENEQLIIKGEIE